MAGIGIDDVGCLLGAEIIPWRTHGGPRGGQQTQVHLGTCAGPQVDAAHPRVEVEAGRILDASGVIVSVGRGPLACATSITSVIVELNEEHVELGALDHGPHIGLRHWALGSTSDEVLLARRAAGSKVLTEALDHGNITGGII